jgi:hypothetical protein
MIDGSSFSGLLTRVEIGHMLMGLAGNGRINSRGSASSLSQRAAQLRGQRAPLPARKQDLPQAHGCPSLLADIYSAVMLADSVYPPATDSFAYGGRMPEKRTSSAGDSASPRMDFVSITQGLLVAECLSFRRAAKVLGIQQSTVSRRVRSLEDVLGVSLFERYNGGVRVTAAGARFFDQARDALLQLDYAAKSASAAGRGAIGRLNIGILSSMAAGFLREVIRAYRARHPDVVCKF